MLSLWQPVGNCLQKQRHSSFINPNRHFSMQSSPPFPHWHPSFPDTVISLLPQDIIFFYCLGLPYCVLDHCGLAYQTTVIYQFFPRECYYYFTVLWLPASLACWKLTTIFHRPSNMIINTRHPVLSASGIH